MSSSSNWVVFNQPGPATSGGVSYSGGGGDAGAVNYRGALDKARNGAQVNGSDYPSGYLGTITDRHQDKLLSQVQSRLTDKSYQRGVHLGEKLGVGSYFWPPEATVKPMDRIRAEENAVVNDMTGVPLMYVKRPKNMGSPVEVLAHMGKLGGVNPPDADKKFRETGVDQAKNPIVVPDPVRQARMQKMLPRYAF